MEPMSESDLTAEVVARFDNTPNERLREIIQSLVTHLHAFAREVRLTDDEWMAGIQFLTAAGHITDDVRQEFILLSDTLGLSSLIDIMNHGSDNEKARMARKIVQIFSASRFSITTAECNSAVPASHGISDAFSTGSQNQNPPQPSS